MTQPRHASQTTVSMEQSKTDIEQTLRRHGADQFLHGWEEGQAIIGFRLSSYAFRMLIPMPRREEFDHKIRKNGRRKMRPAGDARRAWEQAERQAWRTLLLVIRAKLEAVEAGITTLEQEFLASMVMPGNLTVGETLLPNLQETLQTGRVPGIMPGMLPGEDAIPIPPPEAGE